MQSVAAQFVQFLTENVYYQKLIYYPTQYKNVILRINQQMFPYSVWYNRSYIPEENYEMDIQTKKS